MKTQQTIGQSMKNLKLHIENHGTFEWNSRAIELFHYPTSKLLSLVTEIYQGTEYDNEQAWINNSRLELLFICADCLYTFSDECEEVNWNLEDAIQRRNIDRYRDGSLHYASGVLITGEFTEEVKKALDYLMSIRQELLFLIKDLMTLPKKASIQEVRAKCYADSGHVSRDGAIEHYEKIYAEHVEYLTDFFNATRTQLS